MGRCGKKITWLLRTQKPNDWPAKPLRLIPWQFEMNFVVTFTDAEYFSVAKPDSAERSPQWRLIFQHSRGKFLDEIKASRNRGRAATRALPVRRS